MRDISVNLWANLIAAALIWLVAQGTGAVQKNPDLTRLALLALLAAAVVPVASAMVAIDVYLKRKPPTKKNRVLRWICDTTLPGILSIFIFVVSIPIPWTLYIGAIVVGSLLTLPFVLPRIPTTGSLAGWRWTLGFYLTFAGLMVSLKGFIVF